GSESEMRRLKAGERGSRWAGMGTSCKPRYNTEISYPLEATLKISFCMMGFGFSQELAERCISLGGQLGYDGIEFWKQYLDQADLGNTDLPRSWPPGFC